MRKQYAFKGQPNRYSPAIREAICAAIERGMSWREMEAMGIVSRSTLAYWLRKHRDLQIGYEFAYTLRLESLVSEVEVVIDGFKTARTRRELSRMRKKVHAIHCKMAHCMPRASFYYRAEYYQTECCDTETQSMPE